MHQGCRNSDFCTPLLGRAGVLNKHSHYGEHYRGSSKVISKPITWPICPTSEYRFRRNENSLSKKYEPVFIAGTLKNTSEKLTNVSILRGLSKEDMVTEMQNGMISNHLAGYGLGMEKDGWKSKAKAQMPSIFSHPWGTKHIGHM